MTTLKRNYKLKKLNELKTKVKNVEGALLENNVDYQVEMLLEALDEKEYQEATEIIEKLTQINDLAKNAGMILLSGAIDEVIKEINNFTGGTGFSRFKGKMSSLFSKAPAKNPILGGLAMVSALDAGFKILPTVLKNNIPDIEKDKDKMKQTLRVLADEKVRKTIENNLVKAFIPAGTFGKIFKTIPGIDTPKLVADLFFATPGQLGEISKVLKTGTTSGNIDPNLTKPEVVSDKEGKAGEEKTNEPGKAPSEKIKSALTKATQTAAKNAGISDGKALTALMKKMNYEVGSYEASLVIPTLQELMAEKNIDDEQTDGFVRGLMSDFEKEFKTEIQKKIDANLKKMKKEKEEKQKKQGQDKENNQNPQQAFVRGVVAAAQGKGKDAAGLPN